MAILYTFRRCPYAIRARMALAAAEISFEVREVILRNKPPEMLEISPKGTVPVLLINESNRVIEESLDIMYWALEQNSSLSWLSTSSEVKKEILELIAENDTRFKYSLDRYKYADRYGLDPQEHRSLAEVFLQELELRLKEDVFLFGPDISLADIAIFPFIRQFSKVDLDWFSKTPYENLKKWLEYHLESELFLRVMKKYSPWKRENPTV